MFLALSWQWAFTSFPTKKYIFDVFFFLSPIIIHEFPITLLCRYFQFDRLRKELILLAAVIIIWLALVHRLQNFFINLIIIFVHFLLI